MSHIQRQVISAQRRLWINRWLGQFGWLLVGAIVAWMLAWIAHRLFALNLPMAWAALAGIAGAFVGSVIWLILTRDDAHRAATALDEAAGLKERVSSGLSIAPSDDPFARAVMADAERAVAGILARRCIPLRWARSLSWSGAMLAAACLLLLVPPMDLLGRNKSKAEARERTAQVRQVQQAVARPVEAMKQILEQNPELAQPELKDLEAALKQPEARDAELLRRTAIKQIDKLADALRDKLDGDRFNALKETRKRLGKLGEPVDPKSEAGKLMDALSRGDFQDAQDALKKMQDELATRAKEGKLDPEKTEAMRQQMNQLADQLQKLAEDQQSAREMKNAGLSEKEAQKILQELSKKSPAEMKKLAEELAQRLKDKGVTKEQLESMLKKAQERQKASQQCQKMGKSLQQAGQKMQEGDAQAAQSEMEKAAEQLGELEQLEQALNEMEGQLSELQKQRDELSEQESDSQERECGDCQGKGFDQQGKPCGQCQGAGRGMNAGRGAGERPRDDSAETDVKNEKAKVKTNKQGRIIGEQYVKGQQLKGKSDAELSDAAAAAELDATDALNKDRVPRRYRGAVQRYFDRLPQDLRADESDAAGAAPKPGTPN